jgi:hypothetical protein
MSITDPAKLWEAIQHDYVDELRKGQFYVLVLPMTCDMLVTCDFFT